MPADKALVGAAGEHYVAFQMSSRGWAVGFPAQRTRLFDLLVANPTTGKTIGVQVKTATDAVIHSGKWASWRRWRVGKELGRNRAIPGLFVVLVDLRRTSEHDPPREPDVFALEWNEIPRDLEIEHFPAKSPVASATDFWCSFDDRNAPLFKNRWDVIDRALTGVGGAEVGGFASGVAVVHGPSATAAVAGPLDTGAEADQPSIVRSS